MNPLHEIDKDLGKCVQCGMSHGDIIAKNEPECSAVKPVDDGPLVLPAPDADTLLESRLVAAEKVHKKIEEVQAGLINLAKITRGAFTLTREQVKALAVPGVFNAYGEDVSSGYVGMDSHGVLRPFKPTFRIDPDTLNVVLMLASPWMLDRIPPLSSRRLRSFFLDAHALLHIVFAFNRTANNPELITGYDWPVDWMPSQAWFVSVTLDVKRAGFVLTLAHDDYEPVPAGQKPPEYARPFHSTIAVELIAKPEKPTGLPKT